MQVLLPLTYSICTDVSGEPATSIFILEECRTLSTKIHGVICRNPDTGRLEKLKYFMDEKCVVLSFSPYSTYFIFRRVQQTIAEGFATLSIHPSAWDRQTHTGRIFVKLCTRGLYKNLQTFRFGLKSDKNYRHFTPGVHKSNMGTTFQF